MKLWLLQQKGDWRGSHSQVCALVIRAEDEMTARKLCGNAALKEGYSMWLDPELSTCTELLSSGERDILFIFDTVMN